MNASILVSSLTGNEGTFNILTVSSLIGSNIASDNITNIFKLFIKTKFVASVFEIEINSNALSIFLFSETGLYDLFFCK